MPPPPPQNLAAPRTAVRAPTEARDTLEGGDTLSNLSPALMGLLDSFNAPGIDASERVKLCDRWGKDRGFEPGDVVCIQLKESSRWVPYIRAVGLYRKAREIVLSQTLSEPKSIGRMIIFKCVIVTKSGQTFEAFGASSMGETNQHLSFMKAQTAAVCRCIRLAIEVDGIVEGEL